MIRRGVRVRVSWHVPEGPLGHPVLKTERLGRPSALCALLRAFVDIHLGPLNSVLRLIHQLLEAECVEALPPLDAAL